MWMSWLMTMSLAWSASPGSVWVIGNPGLAPEATTALAEHLDARRWTVQAIAPDCPLGSLDDLTVALTHAPVGPDDLVVAHGLGARLAVQAGLQPRGWVFVGPLFDTVPVADMVTLAEQGPGLQQAAQRVFGTADAGCLSDAFIASAASLVHAPAPIPLDDITAPSIVLVSAGDDAAAVEAVLPATVDLQNTERIRVGIGGWGGHDLSHVALIDTRRGRRLVRRALRRLERSL